MIMCRVTMVTVQEWSFFMRFFSFSVNTCCVHERPLHDSNMSIFKHVSSSATMTLFSPEFNWCTSLKMSLLISNRRVDECSHDCSVNRFISHWAWTEVCTAGLSTSLWSPPQSVPHFLQEIKEALTGSSGNVEKIGHWIINWRIKWVIWVKKKIEEGRQGVAMW